VTEQRYKAVLAVIGDGRRSCRASALNTKQTHEARTDASLSRPEIPVCYRQAPTNPTFDVGLSTTNFAMAARFQLMGPIFREPGSGSPLDRESGLCSHATDAAK
jgi:hypothetical protein